MEADLFGAVTTLCFTTVVVVVVVVMALNM